MVAISRRKRMVAHNVADVPFVSAVMARRRTIQEDPSIVFLTGAVHRATRQSRGGAMFRGGSFDRSGGCQEFHGEWRMRREADLSSADPIQEV